MVSCAFSTGTGGKEGFHWTWKTIKNTLHRKMHQTRCKTGEKSLEIQLLSGRNQNLEYGTMVLQFRNGLQGTLKTEEGYLPVDWGKDNRVKNSNNDISYNVPRRHKTGVNNPKNDAFTQAKSEFAIWYNRITVRKWSAANLENRRKLPARIKRGFPWTAAWRCPPMIQKAGGEKQGSFMPKFHRSSVPIRWIPQGFTVDHQE